MSLKEEFYKIACNGYVRGGKDLMATIFHVVEKANMTIIDKNTLNLCLLSFEKQFHNAEVDTFKEFWSKP